METKQEIGIPKHYKSPLSSPPGFNPLIASDEELVKYGFPSRPDKSTHPRLRAVWDKAMSRPVRHIHAEPEPLKHFVPSNTAGKVVPFNVNSLESAGALLQNPPETFNMVHADWVIPTAWPPTSASLGGDSYQNGKWYVGTSIGLFENAADSGLFVGTISIVTVENNKIASQSAYAWYRVLPSPIVLSLQVAVSPGDTVNALACNPRSGVGWASLLNVGSNQVNTQSPALPTSFAADAVTWCIQDPYATDISNITPPANFVTQYIFDALAGNQPSTFDINSAGVVLQNWNQNNTEEATTIQLTPESLVIYSYADIPPS